MNKNLKNFSSIQSIERYKQQKFKIKTKKSVPNSPRYQFQNQNKIEIEKLYQKGNSLLKDNKIEQINLLFQKCLREGQKVLKQQNIDQKYVEVLYRIGEFNYNRQNYCQVIKYLNTCFSLCHKISLQFKNQYIYKTITLTTRCFCKLLQNLNKRQDITQQYTQSILPQQMYKYCKEKGSSKYQQNYNKKYQIIEFFLVIHSSKHKTMLQFFSSLIKLLHKLQNQKQIFIDYKKSNLFYIYRQTLLLCAFVLQFQGFQKQSLQYYLKTKSLTSGVQQQAEYLKILIKIADLKSKFNMSQACSLYNQCLYNLEILGRIQTEQYERIKYLVNNGQQKNIIENQLKPRPKLNFNIHKKNYRKFQRQNKTDIKDNEKNNVNLTLSNQIKPNYFCVKVKKSQSKMNRLPRLQPLFFKEKQFSRNKFQPLKKECFIKQEHKYEKKTDQLLNKNISTLFYFKILQNIAKKYNLDLKFEQNKQVLQTLIFLIKNSLQVNTKKHTQFIYQLFLNYVRQTKYTQALQKYKEFQKIYPLTHAIQNEQNFRITYQVGQIYYLYRNEDELALNYLQKSERIGIKMYRKQDLLSMKNKQMIGNLNLKKKMISQALQYYQQSIRILFRIKTKIDKQDQFFAIQSIAQSLAQLQKNNKKNILKSNIRNKMDDIIQNILKSYFKLTEKREFKNYYSQLQSQFIDIIIQSNDHTLIFFTLIQLKIFINLNTPKQNLQLIRLCYFLLKQNLEDQNNLKISFFKIVSDWLNIIFADNIDIFSIDDEIIQLLYSYSQNINLKILNQSYQLSILVNQFLSNYYYVKNFKNDSLLYSIQVIYLIDHKWKQKLIESNDLYFKNQIFTRALNNAGFALNWKKNYQESILFYHELLNIVRKQEEAKFYLKKLIQMADMLYSLNRDEEALPKYYECLKIIQQRNQIDSEHYFGIQNVVNYITLNMTIYSDNFPDQQSLNKTINLQQNNIIFENQNKNQNNCRVYEIKHQLNYQQNYKVIGKYYVKALYKLTLHFFKLFNYNQALKFVQKLIFIVENAGDNLTQQFAIYLCIQGRILQKKERYDEALKDFQQALKILSKSKKYNLNMSQTLFYIGKLHFNYFQPKHSTQYFERCILSIKKYDGKPNRLYVQALDKLAQAKFSLGLYKEAFKKYKECYEMCAQLYGKEDNLTKDIWQSLENTRKFYQKQQKDIF